MTLCNMPMLSAIGTSAAIGLPIAIAGTAGDIWNGVGKDRLPPLSLGYVYLPAMLAIVVGTLVSVPDGARAAHAWPDRTLRRILAAILLILTIRMVRRVA